MSPKDNHFCNIALFVYVSFARNIHFRLCWYKLCLTGLRPYPLRVTDFKIKLLYFLVCIKFITSYCSFNTILASKSQISSCIKHINLRMKKKYVRKQRILLVLSFQADCLLNLLQEASVSFIDLF